MATRPDRTSSEKHLIEHLSVGHILIAFAILTALVGGIFWFLSSSDELENQGRQARAAMEGKEWAKALKYWQPIIDKYPESPIVNSSMARCFMELKNPQEALPHIEAAEKNAEQIQDNMPEIKALYTLRGWVLMELGSPEEGVQTLQKTLSLDPTYALANHLLAQYYLKNNDFMQAGTYFQRLADEPEYKNEIDQYKQKISERFLAIPQQELSDVPEQVPAGANSAILQSDTASAVPQQQ